MASNFTQEEDEPMHPAGLDMTRESLRDILDGNEGQRVNSTSICAARYNKSIY